MSACTSLAKPLAHAAWTPRPFLKLRRRTAVQQLRPPGLHATAAPTAGTMPRPLTCAATSWIGSLSRAQDVLTRQRQ